MSIKAIAQDYRTRDTLSDVLPVEIVLKYSSKAAVQNRTDILVRDSAGNFYFVGCTGIISKIEKPVDFYWTTENVIITARNITEAWQIAQNRAGEDNRVKASEVVYRNGQNTRKHSYKLTYL